MEYRGSFSHTETIGAVLNHTADDSWISESVMQMIVSRISANKYELFELFLDHWKLVVGTAENRMDANGLATCVFAALFSGVQ